MLARIEDVVDVVGDEGAIDAEVVIAVRGAKVDSSVVRAADTLASVVRAHVTVGSSTPKVLLSLHEVLSRLLPVHVVSVLADDLTVRASQEHVVADAERLRLNKLVIWLPKGKVMNRIERAASSIFREKGRRDGAWWLGKRSPQSYSSGGSEAEDGHESELHFD